MAKAGLLEPQSPVMESHIPRHGVLRDNLDEKMRQSG
jgi:hypothetical protein